MRITNLKGDIFGGITAAIVALPLALAFGVQSGLGAIAGMYGAIALGFFASLFGGTPSQISGPTGPMTVITSLAVASLVTVYGGLDAAWPAIILMFLLAGGVQIMFGLFRLGQVVRYIPYPVISGFMTGIGAIIILLQVFPLLGHSSPKAVVDVFSQLHTPLSDINIWAVVVTLSTIASIYGLPYITRAIPSPLFAISFLTYISYFFQLPIPLIGDIPTGMPTIELGHLWSYDFSHSAMVVEYAITLAALGCIDSLLTSVVADNMTHTRHNSNRELVGQGIGNMLAAAIGGIPGAGATMRTVINIHAGGRGPLSGMLHGVCLLVVVLGAGKLAAQIPLAVLAGILITVGISIVDKRGLKHIWRIPRTDAVIMVSVFLLTVFVDLLQAVGVGMILAAFFFMKKSSELAEEKTIVAPLKTYQDELPWADEENLPKHLTAQTYIKHIEGPLFFGFVTQFKSLVNEIPDVKCVIIRMKQVPYVDQSGLYALEDSILFLQSSGIELYFTGLHSQPETMLRRISLIPELVPEKNIFKNFDTCIAYLDRLLAPE